MKVKLHNYWLSLLLFSASQLSCSESLVKDWEKFGISAAMITTGLTLAGLTAKVIKENIDNYRNYWQERTILEKKHSVHIKDVKPVAYYGNTTEYTHQISLDLPTDLSKEESDQIQEEWKTIVDLHRFDNGSGIILPWTISGSFTLLAVGLILLEQSL